MWAGELGDRNLRMERLGQTSFCLIEATSSGSSRATDLRTQMFPPRTSDCRRNAFPTRWRFLWKLRTWPARSSLFYVLCAGFSWPNSVPHDRMGRFNSSHFTEEKIKIQGGHLVTTHVHQFLYSVHEGEEVPTQFSSQPIYRS